MPGSNHDEADLVERAIAGEAEAFGELYMVHLDAIYRYVYFRVGEKSDAEDLTEQVFLKAWEALPEYKRSEKPFASWLYRIAHNSVIDYYRRTKPVMIPYDTTSAERMADGRSNPISEIIAGEEIQSLAKAISSLPDEQQQIILLRFMEGLSHREIAEIMDKSEAACRMMQHRALTELGRFLVDFHEH